MNILPKKRWHVRNRENIAKVRKDEAAALEEQKEKERRKRLAEQEAKIDLMRKTTEQKYNIANQLTFTESSSSQAKHINFFSHIEEGAAVTDAKNKEHEEELKNEKEKYEKQIGYLTYLGQDTNEANKSVSWFNKPRSALYSKDECDLKGKNKLDPVHMFKPRKKKCKNKKKKKIQDCLSSSDSSSSESEQLSKKNKLLILREQRLKREQEEKSRADKLLAKIRGEPVPEKDQVSVPFTQKYNSQFNPHLARQNVVIK
ncbi:hypothetical protein PGB90_004837 [Kerria lacca]